MKKELKKKLALVLSIVMILAFTVGGTLAYLVTQTETVNNTFDAAHVVCIVNANNDGTIDVTNDGDVDAYIRAAIVVNWMDSTGEFVYGIAPTDSDYSLGINEGTSGDWEKHGDYYYYKESVESKATTEDLVTSIDVTGEAPQGYELCVEVVAEAIQADGTNGTKTAVMDAWGVQP